MFVAARRTLQLLAWQDAQQMPLHHDVTSFHLVASPAICDQRRARVKLASEVAEVAAWASEVEEEPA